MFSRTTIVNAIVQTKKMHEKKDAMVSMFKNLTLTNQSPLTTTTTAATSSSHLSQPFSPSPVSLAMAILSSRISNSVSSMVEDFSSLFGGIFPPPEAPQLVLAGFDGAAVENLPTTTEDILRADPFMWMGPVPKKKTSHAKIRTRWQNKWIYEQHHVAQCPKCGHARFLHNLCAICLKETIRSKRVPQPPKPVPMRESILPHPDSWPDHVEEVEQAALKRTIRANAKQSFIKRMQEAKGIQPPKKKRDNKKETTE